MAAAPGGVGDTLAASLSEESWLDPEEEPVLWGRRGGNGNG